MTILKYLDNTYLFESEAIFVEMKENEKGKAIILDETIFYPQGGGQPSDKGEIVLGDRVFIVTDVRMDEEGVVWHFGEFKNESFNKGDRVHLKIDKDRRILNATLHSAGHLLDCAISNMRIEQLRPTKGFHFPEGPYVEYDGMLENPMEIISLLQEQVDDLLSQNLNLERRDLSPEEADLEGIHAPIGKQVRAVNFKGYPACGCGGTHISRSSEIGKIVIRKIKSGQGKTKIAYAVE